MSEQGDGENKFQLGSMDDADRVMVGIDVVPIGPSADQCEGCVVKLTRGLGDDKERVELAAALSGPQCREVARQLLSIADAASRGSEQTMLCVTAVAMWKFPGQVLIVRREPNGRPHFDFAVKPKQQGGPGLKNLKRQLAVPAQRLLIPGR